MFIKVEVSGHHEPLLINTNQICSIQKTYKRDTWFPYEVRMSNGNIWNIAVNDYLKLMEAEK